MVRNYIFLLLCIFYTFSLSAQTGVPTKIRLTEGWEFLKSDLGGIWEAVRPVKKGAPESVPFWESVRLPHSFNATDAVDPDVNYYQGPGWYRTAIPAENPYQGGRTLLHFEGAGQKTEVWVYTTKVGSHIGGYDEWTVDITEAVEAFKKRPEFHDQFKGKVPISIRCDNSRDLEMIPSDLSDFNIYGGLYRYLNLVYVPALSLDKVFATAAVDKAGAEGSLKIRTRIYNPDCLDKAELSIRLFDPKGKVISKYSKSINPLEVAEQEIWRTSIKKPHLWSPDSPVRYALEVSIRTPSGTHTQHQNIGFRHFEFLEKGPFHLNGKRLLLRGTHRHEDHAGVANAMTAAQMQEEMLLMKEVGVNFIRLGHYQQSRVILDLCDSLGILVWEEIPWCRGGLGGEVYKEQARRMLTNMIEQHYNHPSVIIWGLGNENDWPGDFAEFDQQKIRTFMAELNDLAHQLDPSRKTAIRRCDFCKDIVDVYSPSIWAGWYRGAYTEYKEVSEEEFGRVNHFLHVEWGGDSHARRHAENPDKVLAQIRTGKGADERMGDASLYGGAARVSKDGDWSESYICNLIDWHLKEQETMPWLTGTAYWPFKDFSTPVRPENPVPYVNQKGIIERDFTPKESYYVFQSYWARKPMVHIYGHSWPVRWGEKGEEKMIKVYSNCDEAELFVNGKSRGIKKRNSQDFPAAGLRWMVALNDGNNEVMVVAWKGKVTMTDKITFNYQTEKWEEPAQLVLEKLSAQQDTVLVQLRVLDEKGVACLDAAQFVRFSLAGDGRLIENQGTSTGSSKVQLYNGRALIRVKTNGGRNVISAQADGLPTAMLYLGKEEATKLGDVINATAE
ncbi:glycoside hydrolase family 2 TIM barrel-domain containing protein [Cesiribacter sp. SM1]|uniref:glycoside hydrolase family 2 TIM barrel-domain containing protein n=1 Tax=Cesiribacter sp. SM1 TaxID=2861196 RepID=UPI001CD42A86|nr:glycoside hydrolase family 2 TIM barrel-domain containing protein [Cesiribacter sp. SM1]